MAKSSSRSSSALTARPVRVEDKARWNQLWQGYLSFYESSVPDEITELTWERIMNSHHPYQCFVAELDGQIIGIAHCFMRPSTWSRAGYCYLEDLFVDPTIRGVGAGRALINQVIEYARSQKADRVYWTTKENNTTARKLYDSYLPKSEFVQYRLPQKY
jgi:GNAT superfamily N-acetyltransferase